MARRATLLFAYGQSNDLIFAADSRAMSSTGFLHSDSERKLAVIGPRGVCAIGGYCDGTIKTGPRVGWHWKLIDAFASIPQLPTRSASDRASAVFAAAYNSAFEYMQHDTDEGIPGVCSNGITILYGEVSKMGNLSFYRADMPVEISELGSGWKWSVQPPIFKEIFPGTPQHALPFVYYHNPEIIQPTEFQIPPDDKRVLDAIEKLFAAYSQHAPGNTVGGKVAVIRVSNSGARWINA